MPEEILNLEYHRRRLLLISLNRFRTKTEAWTALGISKHQLYILIEKYNVKFIDGKYMSVEKENKQTVVYKRKHKWKDNTCARCGLRRKERALSKNLLSVGHYFYDFLVDGKWIMERPECLTYKSIDDASMGANRTQ